MDIIKVRDFLSNGGHKLYRLKQIKKSVFINLADGWDDIALLPAILRDELKKNFSFSSLENINMLESKKKDSLKAVFKLRGGGIIEAVLMKHVPKKSSLEASRRTVCVSSQVGCAMGCGFCATGKMGYRRNLTCEEIIDQVLFFACLLKKTGARVDNVVFMGMGEPFLNYDNVMEAIRILNDKDGFNLGARHVSISTCGIIPAINQFADENLQVNLAISLHAADNAKRTKLMPINKTYPLEKLMRATEEYVKKTNRKVMFEYLLIDGVNDSKRDALKLAKLMNNNLYHVNLIKYHDTGGSFKPSPQEKRTQFFDTLKKQGVSVTFRVSFGEDILAACGQLAGKQKNAKI